MTIPRALQRLMSTAAAGVLVASSLLVATPANAATCSGTSCDGTDPASTGCSADAQNANVTDIMHNGVVVAVLELRWSPSCRTNWGRISNRVSPQNEVRVWAYRGATKTVKTRGFGQQYYSDQLYGWNMVVCAVGRVDTPAGDKIKKEVCA
ncbi:DUF2690 domain-containing protein [Micromonospora lutea]|uniref:DUF2690 domain-containing protein n=1 Tax=Micromonospora lutea TaxID=419825 RepID=A0ABQ4IQB5_9ACTN|nr:DUF2690 domain-containing protein [Micromonospora lutea]GIJ20015.1 hypothetical protein Vlu01_06390 [Micromonospora lutea]